MQSFHNFSMLILKIMSLSEPSPAIMSFIGNAVPLLDLGLALKSVRCQHLSSAFPLSFITEKIFNPERKPNMLTFLVSIPESRNLCVDGM